MALAVPSANVYDSLAEAYERTGHLNLAAPLSEKASNLGQQTKNPNLAVYLANFERASTKLKLAGAEKKTVKVQEKQDGSTRDRLADELEDDPAPECWAGKLPILNKFHPRRRLNPAGSIFHHCDLVRRSPFLTD